MPALYSAIWIIKKHAMTTTPVTKFCHLLVNSTIETREEILKSYKQYLRASLRILSQPLLPTNVQKGWGQETSSYTAVGFPIPSIPGDLPHGYKHGVLCSYNPIKNKTKHYHPAVYRLVLFLSFLYNVYSSIRKSQNS